MSIYVEKKFEERMTGKKVKIKECTINEIKKMRLLNTPEKIPTLSEVLELVKGRVPIIIELKYDRKVGDLEQRVAEILDKYEGQFAVKSFNPLSVLWFRRNRPNFIRGLLIANKYKNVFQRIASRALFIKICSPDFISCDYRLYNNKQICKMKQSMVVIAWTIKDDETLKKMKDKFDSLICENI